LGREADTPTERRSVYILGINAANARLIWHAKPGLRVEVGLYRRITPGW
jgi:hypothetical protein